MRRRFCRLVVLLLVLALAAPALGAEKAKGKKKKQREGAREPIEERILKGHQYMRSSFFPLALTATNLGVTLGYFYSQVDLDQKQDFFLFKEDRLRYGGLDQTINYEYRFVELFSLEFLLEGRALSGVDERSALAAGGQGTVDVTFIPKFNVLRQEKWGTAITLAGAYSYGTYAKSSPFILFKTMYARAQKILTEAVADGETITEDEFRDAADIQLEDSLVSGTQSSIAPMLLFAQTVGPALGVQLAGGFSVGLSETASVAGESVDTEDPPTAFFAGGALTLDFNPFSPLHLGLRGEASYEQITNDDQETSVTSGGGGFVYTGRRNLDLGLVFIFSGAETDTDLLKGTETDYFLLMNTRYYF